MENKLPEGWEWKKLGEIGEICSGGTPSTRDETNFDGNIPWVTPADLSNFEGIYIEKGKRNISEKGLSSSSAKLLPKNSVIFSSRAPIGYVAIASNPLTTNQGFKNIILKEEILPEYIYYYLKKSKRLVESYASGTTFLEVSATRFSQIPVVIPPLETQQKIVSLLEKAEETKKLRAQADELTQKLLQSVFLEMFGDPVKNPRKWDERSLESLLDEDPQNGLYKPSTDYGEGTQILRIDSFYDGKISNIKKLKRLNCTPEEIKKYGLNIGEVLINRVNSLEYLGKCGLVETLFEPTVFESNIMRLKLKKSTVNPEYLTSFLCTQFIKNQILQKAKKAVNQASINQADVKSLKILLPPIQLQNNYSFIIKQIERTKQSQKQSSLEINNLFDALMQKAFTGELIA
jgi:type I restriction enzyme S subunit